MSSSIDVILPALNEALALPSVIDDLPDGFHAIVVDNASDDGTGDIARSLGATVVLEPLRGFGAACHAGLMAATSDIVCIADCDGSFSMSDLIRVAAPVQAGTADLVLGARQPEPGSWPAHARFANAVLARELRRRTKVALHDLGPMRATRREALIGLNLADRRFGYPLEMVLAASRAGWRIEEIGVRYAPRIGKSKITGTVKGTFRAVKDMSGVLR